jgi:metal-responsive CopG/Arc/MetJ family transcriptional regulator
MQRVSVQLRRDQYDELKQITKPGLSMSYLIRIAIDEYISLQKLDENKS